MKTLTQTAGTIGAATCQHLLDHVANMLDEGSVTGALDALFDGLLEARGSMDRGAWLDFARYLRSEHPLRHTIYQDPMTQRAHSKPRGYAGDAVMMDYLYGIHSSDYVDAEATAVGRQLYRYVQSRPAGQAVQFRRRHIASLIDGLAAGASCGTAKPSVLGVAAGHLREAELSTELASGRIGRFVALDADADSLRAKWKGATARSAWKRSTRRCVTSWRAKSSSARSISFTPPVSMTISTTP
jgi:extracellular factor (EF) 3-hydroxypalmitic acid methyl ester biosynthesis protein